MLREQVKYLEQVLEAIPKERQKYLSEVEGSNQAATQDYMTNLIKRCDELNGHVDVLFASDPQDPGEHVTIMKKHLPRIL